MESKYGYPVCCSLALAHYVSGYVTKAERSNMQEVWQEVSENHSIYCQLWSFGIQSLRSRECGLYEASDLLGDHVSVKNLSQWCEQMFHCLIKETVDWRITKCWKKMAKDNAETEKIFEEKLIDSYYPQRPHSLTSLCSF